jgi:hypothetical protein
VGWVHGSLIEPPLGDAPDYPEGDLAALLDSAEDIVNEAAPAILAEVRQHDGPEVAKRGRRWWKFGR